MKNKDFKQEPEKEPLEEKTNDVFSYSFTDEPNVSDTDVETEGEVVQPAPKSSPKVATRVILAILCLAILVVGGGVGASFLQSKLLYRQNNSGSTGVMIDNGYGVIQDGIIFSPGYQVELGTGVAGNQMVIVGDYNGIYNGDYSVSLGNREIPEIKNPVFPANETIVQYKLSNPEGNDCSLQYTFVLQESNEVIYQSVSLLPGESITELELYRPLEKGTYSLEIRIKSAPIDFGTGNSIIMNHLTTTVLTVA